MNKSILVLFIVFISFGKISAQNSKEFDASYQVALQQYKNNAFERAYLLFTPLVDNNAKNTHRIEAKYFRAMCLYKQNKLDIIIFI